jgi:hypothetical protein
VQLDGEGTVVRAHSLPLPVKSPHKVTLLPDGQGGLILCYLSGLGEERRLYSAHLDAAGQVLAGPAEVSEGDLSADGYTAAAGASGVEVFWSNEAQPTRGLYHRRLDQAGNPTGASRLLAEGGMKPCAQAAEDGHVHLAWLYEPGAQEEHMYYASFDPATHDLSTPVPVSHFALNPRATLYGPVLSLSRGRVHIAWAWQHLASSLGAAAGEGECWMVSFPFGAAGTTAPQRLSLPAKSSPDYELAQGTFGYTQLARAREGGSALVYMPDPVAGEREEAALGLAFETATRTSSRVQIGVVYLADGAVKGYQIAARGGNVVVRPALAADGQNQLYLAWLEPAGFHRYLVYYASTREATRAALGRFGRDDIIEGAYTLAWTLVQGASMFPIAFVWLAIPMAWVVGYYLVKADADLHQRGPRIALVVALVLYMLCKLALMPGSFLEAAPLLSRLPPQMADLYMGALPVAIAVAGLGALRLYLKRVESSTLLIGYVVFAGTDALLTILLYAPGILG